MVRCFKPVACAFFLFAAAMPLLYARIPWFTGSVECLYVQGIAGALNEISQNENLAKAYEMDLRTAIWKREIRRFCQEHNLYLPVAEAFYEKSWVLAWYDAQEAVPEFSVDRMMDLSWTLNLLRDALRNGVVAVEDYPGALEWLSEVYGGPLASVKNGETRFCSAFQNMLQMAMERVIYREDFSKSIVFFQEPSDRIIEVKNAYKFLQVETKTEKAYHAKYARFSEKEALTAIDAPMFLEEIERLTLMNVLSFKENIRQWFTLTPDHTALDQFFDALSDETELILFQSSGKDWVLTFFLSVPSDTYRSLFESWGIILADDHLFPEMAPFLDDICHFLIEEKRLHFSNRSVLPSQELPLAVKEEMRRLAAESKTFEIDYARTLLKDSPLHTLLSRRYENNLLL
ncbi:MAG: hypothetical protein PHX90_04535, partial [Thermotogota bacterium]|nr:hypothetical protein [Thermotogota bacterium]